MMAYRSFLLAEGGSMLSLSYLTLGGSIEIEMRHCSSVDGTVVVCGDFGVTRHGFGTG